MADVEVVGSPEVVKVIARGPAGTGSGSTITNWAMYSLIPATPASLTPDYLTGADSYAYKPADFTLEESTETTPGDEFSVVDSGDGSGSASVLSVGGGHFNFASYLATVADGTHGFALDAGSSRPRYLWLAGSPGVPAPGSYLGNIGLDINIPILSAGSGPFPIRASGVGTPAFISPGGTVVSYLNVNLRNGYGTDLVPLADLGIELLIWQVS